MQAHEVLGGIGLFADALDPRQLDQLAARCRVVPYSKGAILMHEGDLGAFMVVIVSGCLGVAVAGRRSAPREVARLGPGDVVGEMSLLTGARRAATVTALEPTEVVEIRKVALEAMLLDSPQLLDRFGAVLAARREELGRIAHDRQARRILGRTTEEIVDTMRRFFAHTG